MIPPLGRLRTGPPNTHTAESTHSFIGWGLLDVADTMIRLANSAAIAWLRRSAKYYKARTMEKKAAKVRSSLAHKQTPHAKEVTRASPKNNMTLRDAARILIRDCLAYVTCRFFMLPTEIENHRFLLLRLSAPIRLSNVSM